MTLSEVKEYLGELISKCFPDEKVIWAEQYAAQSGLPLTTLKLRDVGIPLFPITVDEEGQSRSFYECTRVLEINRYTKGKSYHEENEIAGQENTAADDLTGLLLYLQAEEVALGSSIKNVCILQAGPIRDLSALENGTRYKYRAMQEYQVKFQLHYANGKTEAFTPDADQEYSGPVGWFENIETEENYNYE